MKVQMTVEFSDLARMAVGLKQSGELRPATRIECRDWATEILTDRIGHIQQVVQLAVDELLQQGFVPVPDAKLTD